MDLLTESKTGKSSPDVKRRDTTHVNNGGDLLADPLQNPGDPYNSGFTDPLLQQGPQITLASNNAPRSSDASPAGLGNVAITLRAFIPGSLGKPLSSCEHPTGLENQEEVDQQIAAVAGNFIPEPYQLPTLNDGYKYFSTDDRSFSSSKVASSRLWTTGTIPLDALSIGSPSPLPFKDIFTSDCYPSTQTFVEVESSVGWSGLSQKGKLIKNTKSAKPNKPQAWSKVSNGDVLCEFSTEAPYPHTPEEVTPNIDYSAIVRFSKTNSGAIELSIQGDHNGFPAYELIVNGQSLYEYMPADTGPGLVNLGWEVVRIPAKRITLGKVPPPGIV